MSSQGSPVAIRFVAEERFDPFAVDVGAPPGAIQVRYCQLEQDVAHWCRVEHVGVQKCCVGHGSIAVPLLLRFLGERFEDRFPFAIDARLVVHHVFHT